MKTLPMICLASFVLFFVADRPPQTQSAEPPNKPPQKLPAAHLPNPYRLTEKVISGGLPEGEAAFKELQALGVKTIISVDGALPDVELARQHGMRYIHMPHGYDGIPQSRVTELAKAVRDLEGPIYIHCHHGKHRSPTAAAVACVAAGVLDPNAAVTVLTTAGASENYRGLYESAKTARRIDDAVLDQAQVEYRETAEIKPLAAAMVEVEHTHDHLKAIAAAGWISPPDHPDLDPAHEALLLREHFTELLRTDAVRKESKPFQGLIQESEAAALKLEQALRALKADKTRSAPPREAAEAFERVTTNCATCHQQFRDVPLREKGVQ